MKVNTFLVKGKQIIEGKVYEFLGEILEEKPADEENTDMEKPDISKILLKAKILKENTGF